MVDRAQALAEMLIREPHRAGAFQALSEELDTRGNEVRSAELRAWWANMAPSDREAAQALYDAALLLGRRDPDHPRVIEYLLAALVRDPSHDAVAHALRDHLLRASRAHEVEQVFAEWCRATRRDGCPPTLCARAFVMLAVVRHERLDDLDGAISALEDALQSFPKQFEAMNMLASLYKLRSERTAEVAGSRRRDDRARAAELHYQLGSFETGELAISHLNAALDLVPIHVAALEALLQKLTSDSEQAISRLSTFVTKAPERVRTSALRRELVWRLRFVGRPEQAQLYEEESAVHRLPPLLDETDQELPSLPTLPSLAAAIEVDPLLLADTNARPANEQKAAPEPVLPPEVMRAAGALLASRLSYVPEPTTEPTDRLPAWEAPWWQRWPFHHRLGLAFFAVTSIVALTSLFIGRGP